MKLRRWKSKGREKSIYQTADVDTIHIRFGTYAAYLMLSNILFLFDCEGGRRTGREG